ncbi:hypothetical protein MXD81_24470, partial [Microbacteriaceae bacterium K1510]|nr:hypothetical protein [Microbacteriaceae bacterium K1510]
GMIHEGALHPFIHSQTPPPSSRITESRPAPMKKFQKFYIEITSVCNLACHFCPPTLREKSFLKPEDFAKRLDEIKPYTDSVYLH